jgi:hypothetical protein
VTESTIHQVAFQFGLHCITSIKSFSEGLIHHTYKVQSENNQALVIQAINTHVFQQPEIIISNYRTLYDYLQKEHFIIPTPIRCVNGNWMWKDENGVYWRAQEFIPNSYSEQSITSEKAFQAAHCFARFASTLAGLDSHSIQETIIHFHDLRFRYQQLQDAIVQALTERLNKSNDLIMKVFKRVSLIDFYDSLLSNNLFKKRIMHHDCKLTNILFSHDTHLAICPVDLDTTMPGYYFSDLGDMIRSMTPTVDENSTDWNSISIKKEIYASILDGYRSGIGDVFTQKENQHLHHAGLLMIFMQAIRFLTDFLSNDRYYKISYPEQNLNRAKNQLILLEKLEDFLKKEYQYIF